MKTSLTARFFSRLVVFPFPLALVAALVLTVASAAVPLASAATEKVASAPVPAADTAALAAITPAKYPDADYVIVDSATRTRYAADGSSRTHDTTLYKVLTEKGRRELRTRNFSYNVFYENFKIVSVRILKPAGAAVSVDIAANSKEMIDRAMMGANIYDPNDKVVSLALPALEVGDAVEIVFDRTVKHSYMANTFFDLPTFEGESPILHLVYEVRGPTARPLKSIALLGKVGDTVRYTTGEESGEIVHRWEARDVPQAFPEPSMPGLDSCGQRLRISTAASWEEISKWYWDISEPHLKRTPAMDAKVRELTVGATTDDEKIRRIFRFVSQEIRYMGITLEKDAPGFEPHDVHITFENRYGVCRDKAALLVAMLRSAGLEAYPVLIMAGPLLDKEVPTPYFNHAITAVRHKDGTYQLMDTTNEHTADLFPAYLFNKSYLVSHPQGDTLRVSPVAPPDDNMLRADTRLVLDSAGDAQGQVTFDFTGINDNAYRAHFVRQKPEDIRRFFEAVVKGVVPGATLTALDVAPANMQDPTPLRVRLGFTAKGFFPVTGTILPTPWFAEQLAIASRVLGRGTSLEKRRFPLDISITCGLSENLAITLPKEIGAALALPAADTLEAPALRYTRQFTRDGATLRAAIELKLTAPRVEPAAYAALKNALKEIEYSGRQQPVFASREAVATGTAAAAAKRVPDVDILHRDHKIDLQTETGGTYAWTSRITEKRRVNTYAGKKDSGELKIDYNPVWETVRLVSAKVTQADGVERVVKPEEINIMDAAWVASAPRYPAGKTFVVSLPGVEVGALVEYTLERVAKNRLTFYIEKNFFSFDKVHDDNFTLTTPKWLEFDNPNCKTEDLAYLKSVETPVSPSGKPSGKYVMNYKGKSYGGAEKENALPPLHTFAPGLRVATHKQDGASFAPISIAAWELSEPTDAIKAKAAEIVKNPPTWLPPNPSYSQQGEESMYDRDARLGPIRAIRDFVAKNIRLAGPNFMQLPIACLTPAEKTLADGYGNEADRAILLASLLKAAGYNPEFVLATDGPTLQCQPQHSGPFPTGSFNRLVVRLTVETQVPHSSEINRETLYLDQVSQYAELGATALEGAFAIGIRQGVFTIEAEVPKIEFATYSIKVTENGDAEIGLQQLVVGPAFEGFRRHFVEMTPEERNRYEQQLVTSIAQSATPTKPLDVDYRGSFGRLRLQVHVPRFAVRTGDYLYLDLPSAVRELAAAFSDKRILPFALDGRADANIQWEIKLPKGAKVISEPKPIRWEFHGGQGKGLVPTKWGNFGFPEGMTVSVQQRAEKDGTLTLEVKQSLRRSAPVVVPADNYPSLLDINRKLSVPSQWQVLVKLPKK